MILAAHQPQYLPWLGMLDKVDRCDVFVVLDTVQFKKNEWQNRNRIRTAQGWQWLTVPVRHRFGQRLHEVEVAGDLWRRKHRVSLRQAYGRAPGFAEAFPDLEALLRRPWKRLAALNEATLRWLMAAFGITTPVVAARDVPHLPDDDPDRRLIALCRRFGADGYLAGDGGRAYMDLRKWEQAGIRVIWQQFRHPVYPQRQGEFVPALSAVDLLFQCGSDAFETVRRARREAA